MEKFIEKYRDKQTNLPAVGVLLNGDIKFYARIYNNKMEFFAEKSGNIDVVLSAAEFIQIQSKISILESRIDATINNKINLSYNTKLNLQAENLKAEVDRVEDELSTNFTKGE